MRFREFIDEGVWDKVKDFSKSAWGVMNKPLFGGKSKPQDTGTDWSVQAHDAKNYKYQLDKITDLLSASGLPADKNALFGDWRSNYKFRQTFFENPKLMDELVEALQTASTIAGHAGFQDALVMLGKRRQDVLAMKQQYEDLVASKKSRAAEQMPSKVTTKPKKFANAKKYVQEVLRMEPHTTREKLMALVWYKFRLNDKDTAAVVDSVRI